MKKFVVCMIVILAFVFNSCQKEPDTVFNESLLIGKWVSGTVHYKYLSDHSGTTWDTADDVTEAEGQPFTWTLDKSELTQIHILVTGGSVPKIYTLTLLTATALKYNDPLGSSYSFTKE